ncbi:MAG: hypothetical protein ACNS62_00490 [Candidatus Cyclobacteriaceae bacterium M3_2C_046]
MKIKSFIKIRKQTVGMLGIVSMTMVTALQPLQAQDWLKLNGNLYTLPSVKIGIGTATPTRNLEMNAAIDNYLRIRKLLI